MADSYGGRFTVHVYLNGKVQYTDAHSQWTHTVPGTILAVDTCDLFDTGYDQIIISTWEGTIRILDTVSLDTVGNVTDIQVPSPLHVARIGQVQVTSRRITNTDTLVVLTQEGQVFLYKDIGTTLACMIPSTAVDVLHQVLAELDLSSTCIPQLVQSLQKKIITQPQQLSNDPTIALIQYSMMPENST